MFDWFQNASEYNNNISSWCFQSKTNDILIFFSTINFFSLYLQEAYIEPSRTYTMEFFAKIVNGFKLVIIFSKKLHRRCSTRF